MMIDFAMEAERRGIGGRRVTPREAIEQACLLRFRPIMMTTLAALLGAVPEAMRVSFDAQLGRTGVGALTSRLEVLASGVRRPRAVVPDAPSGGRHSVIFTRNERSSVVLVNRYYLYNK
jgi:hypothetical protein